MKQHRFFILLVLSALMAICSPAYAFASGIPSSSGNSVIQIDGKFDDWKDVPYSYEYNWNNPYILHYQWNPVTQKNETITYTDENGRPYNTTIRHKMSLYRDDQFVYLHIIMAKNYYHSIIGDDYEFWCDGKRVMFQVVMPGGRSITSSSFGPGIHPVEVRHGDSGIAWSIAKGSEAMLKRNPNGVNDELEMKIPFSEFKRQRPSIDPDNIRVLEFFTPNLMYRHIACAGTDTAPYIGIAVCAAFAVAGYSFYRKKGKQLI